MPSYLNNNMGEKLFPLCSLYVIDQVPRTQQQQEEEIPEVDASQIRNPTSVATASLAKAVSRKVSKHEKTVSVCQAKINTIKDVVSKSLTDNKISHEEFVLIKSEYEKYYEMKRSIREKNRTPTLPQVDVKKMEENIRAEMLKKLTQSE